MPAKKLPAAFSCSASLAVLPSIYSYLDQFSRWQGFERFTGWLMVREERK